MRKSLEILDRYDKKENIYSFVLKLADSAHKMLAKGSLSGSDNVSDVLTTAMEELENWRKSGDEH